MNKGILIGVGVVVAVAVLAGAAFVGAQMLGVQPKVASPGGDRVMKIQGGGGPDKTFNLDFIPAKELPATPADESGIFVRRQDDSIFIGTGEIRVQVQRDESGKMESSSSHDGPEIEVVIPHDAKIYQDVTLSQYEGDPPEGQRFQQVLEAGTLDGIGEHSTVTVWGNKSGNRITASTVVYSQPAFMIKRGASQ
jgi:hypothetical protein